MRTPYNVFHLAIPVDDLNQSKHFYVDLLGCKLARRYPDRITLDFFGDQLVCHLHPRPNQRSVDLISNEDRPTEARMTETLDLYPRHFGITFQDLEDFRAVYDLAVDHQIRFFRKMDTRFEGQAEVHQTFVVVDPSDNLIEFKHYSDPEMMY